MIDAAKQIGRQYGAYAFGIVAVLVLWYFIVAPQLKTAQTAQGQLVQTTANLAEVAQANERAAHWLYMFAVEQTARGNSR